MERRERIKELLEAAEALPAGDRSAFLARECNGDPDLRREIEELLLAGENSPHLNNSFAFQFHDGDDMIGQELEEKYRIIAKLGEGGMGTVYLANEYELPRLVAIKVLRSISKREIEAMVISSGIPNVATIYGKGITKAGLPYIAMEYIEGTSLQSILRTRPQLPLVEVAHIIKEVGHTVNRLHLRQLIHRDLKPSNLMVETDSDANVKVIDLGIARIENPVMTNLTTDFQPKGTPYYMSLEQLDGKHPVSKATDVFALGIIAYEALTGKIPFAGPHDEQLSAYELLHAVIQRQKKRADFVDPKTLRPDLSKDAQTLILQAISPDPAKRFSPGTFQNAAEFGKQLASALGQPIHPPRFTKAVALAVAMVVLLMAGIAGTVYLVSRSQQIARATSNGNSLPKPPNHNQAPAAPAEIRELSLWFTQQQPGNPRSAPEPITAQDLLKDNWDFYSYFVSPTSGYLYLLNDGPTGQKSALRLLFPVPWKNKGTAKLVANQAFEAFGGTIKPGAEIERVWVVWSEEPVKELEKLSKYANRELAGFLDKGDIDATLAFLKTIPLAVAVDDKKLNRTVLRGPGKIMFWEISLRHA
jgi:serine/threonine protein kinase